MTQATRPRKNPGAGRTQLAGSGKLRIGDDWNAITIIALSQDNPLKTIAELVENSIDAKARKLRDLVRLYAKEMMRRNFPGLPAAELLDRLIELSPHTEENVFPARAGMNRCRGGTLERIPAWGGELFGNASYGRSPVRPTCAAFSVYSMKRRPRSPGYGIE